MLLRALLAAVHYLALALGLGSVFARGLRLRQLRRTPQDREAVAALMRADAGWGVAAFLWLATGLPRVFAGLDRASGFYLRNGFFYAKMGLFALVLALEAYPMVTFIRWRKAARSTGGAPVAGAPLATLIGLNDAEVVVVILIPFVAALMARGAWLF
jgi:putative membrane protein